MIIKATCLTIVSFVCVILCRAGRSHDIWIETNTPVVREGEPFTLEFKLGNCDHGSPDFLASGMLPRESMHASILSPSEVFKDISQALHPTSSVEVSGSWRCSHTCLERGTYWVVQEMDEWVEHGQKMRGRLSAKVPIVVSASLDVVDAGESGYLPPLPYELELDSDPLVSLESSKPIVVRALKRGLPVSNSIVTFAPFGVELKTPHDLRYQVQTDEKGAASFYPDEAGTYLISTRTIEDTSKNGLTEATYYSATLFLHVSNKDRTGHIN